MTEFEPDHIEAEERGEVVGMTYAIGQIVNDDDLVAVSFDVAANSAIYLSAEELRQVADHIDDVAENEEEPEDD